MPAVRNRTDLLVRLVARCDTAAAHATTPPPCPSGSSGCSWSPASWPPGWSRVGPVRPGAAAPRRRRGREGVRARYAILVDPATGAVLWGRQEPHARAAGQPDQDADRAGRPGQPRPGRRDGGLAGGGQPAGPSPGDEARPEAHRRPGPEGPDDGVRQRRGGDAGRGGGRVGGPVLQGHGRRVGAARPARLLLAQPARPRCPWPPLDRLRPGHPGPGRAPGPLAGPGRAQAPRGLHHARAAAGTRSPPAPGSCSATGAPSGSRPASPTTPGTAWPPRPPGAGGP